MIEVLSVAISATAQNPKSLPRATQLGSGHSPQGVDASSVATPALTRGGTKFRRFRLSMENAARQAEMMWFAKSWIEAAQFSFDVQAVIAMRLMKIAAGGRGSGTECTRMVMEKFETLIAAQTAGALALAKGKSLEAATDLAMVPFKRSVRANRLRLIHG
jgi:hypothetical protein